MKNANKSIAMLIAKKNRPGGDSQSGHSEEDGMAGEALNLAAEEIMAAIESKDVGALREALESFWEMC